MSDKRFVAEQVDVVNEDETEVWDIVFDTENTYAFMVRDTDTASDLCGLLNEQQATIQSLKEENSNLNSILNEVGLQKPFIKILDDYMIEYDGSCFSMHKPSDIRSFVYLMNRNNNFDELQCEYNDESMVIDDE